ncbi:ribonuclease P protein subunit [Methanosarcinales archaeon]|nr:MAG: ribonuclease P protein subunit [Methanosarcinales archaeon]
MITPRNIVHHELIGLKVEVVSSTNPYLVGIKGKVVDETRNMLVIEMDGEEKKVPKDCCTFLFELDDCYVKVEGRLLVARPEDRISKKYR